MSPPERQPGYDAGIPGEPALATASGAPAARGGGLKSLEFTFGRRGGFVLTPGAPVEEFLEEAHAARLASR